MRILLTRAFALLLLAASCLQAQTTAPQCDDEACRAFQTVIADAPSGYRHVHGAPLSAGYWDVSPRPAGMEYCQVGDQSWSATVICHTSFSTSDLATAKAVFDRLKAALQKAVPGWCFRYSSSDGTLYFTAVTNCTSFAPGYAVQLEMAPKLGNGTQFWAAVMLNTSSSITADDVRRAHTFGTVTFHGLPSGAHVGLTGNGSSISLDDFREQYSGEADSSGNALLTGVHLGMYDVRVTAMGHKPFNGKVTVTGDDAPVLNPTLEPGPLSVDEVADALKKGMPPERMKAFITELGVDFDLNDENEARLRAAGADAELLLVVAKNRRH